MVFIRYRYRKKLRAFGFTMLDLFGVFLGYKIYANHAEKKAHRKLEELNATRGQEFTDYIFAEVKRYVSENEPSFVEIRSFAKYYNPAFSDKHINVLINDSTVYAKLISRDASVVIAELDGTYIKEYTLPGSKVPTIELSEKSFRATLRKSKKTNTSFGDAMKYIKNQQPTVTKIETRQKEVPAGQDNANGDEKEIEFEDVTVEVPNDNRAYAMKGHIMRLKKISRDLALERAAREYALNGRKYRGR